MKKRLMISLAIGVSMAAMLPGVASANFSNGPSSVGIVERFSAPGMGFWFDETDELVVIANANSVADACNGTPAGAGDVQELALPNGVSIGLLHDDDVPVLVVPLVQYDPCADPDNFPVIATGTGDVRSEDNDIFVSGSRTNSFGSRLTGRVVDGDGKTWSVQAHFRARIDQDGEFVLTREDVHLTKRGK